MDKRLTTLSEFFPDLLEEAHCVMVPLAQCEELMEYISRIPDSILYNAEDNEYGREKMPHITVLYGILPIAEEKAKTILKRLPKNITATLGTISLFENAEFDVLKIDVDSPHLHRVNEFLCKNVEYHNDYPNYHPHVTLAYLKKGTGGAYINDNRFKGKKHVFETTIYSDHKRNHEQIPMQEYGGYSGTGGGYGGAAGGPVVGSYAATPNSPGNTPGSSTSTRRSSYMQGNTVVNNGLYDTITDKDLSDKRFEPDEIRQGIRQEMKRMEFPDKTVALRTVIQHLEQNPKYYSDLHMYLDSGI